MIAIFRTPKTPWPLWVLAGIAYCASPFLNASFYVRKAAEGVYPSNADSIGIPIAFDFAGTLLLLPVVAWILRAILSRYPGSTVLCAWNRERPIWSVGWTTIWLLTLLGSLRAVRSDCRTEMWFALPFDCISMYVLASCRAILVSRPAAKTRPPELETQHDSIGHIHESLVGAGAPDQVRRPTNRAIAIVCVGTVLFVLFGLPALFARISRTSNIPAHIRATNHLRSLAIYTRAYALDHDDRYPARLEDALVYLRICDSNLTRFVQEGHITYTPPATRANDTPTNHVLLRYEARKYILEYPTDGEVRRIPK